MQDLLDGPFAESARDFRRRVRAGAWTGQTAGTIPGAQQVNLAIVPQAAADAFAAFCAANPRPCPVLARTAPGARAMPTLGRDLDVARDAPAYRVFRHGERAERLADLDAVWRDDFVAFALGCSFSFEAAMEAAGIPVRHARLGKNVAMYVSNVPTAPAPPFAGPMVVSMRPIRPEQADRVRDLCAAFPLAHGAPVHVGDPADMGIADVTRPDFGDPPDIADGEVCAFWACGVTPQLALVNAGLEIAVTHEPGHMLVTDLDAASPDLRQWLAA
ncbi:MAG: putative hydro-lyase [Hyphomicrobiales bacterium]|nr:putative hydro-lyase [Hyphomicrobiales bacterium]MCP5370808.1 putative hydro-lyase [Hyphomicrobiales bacterium]